MASDGPAPAPQTQQRTSEQPPEPAHRDPRRVRQGRALGAIVIAVAVAAAVGFALTATVPDSEVVAHVAVLHELPPTRPAPGPGQLVGGLELPLITADGWTPTGARLDAVGTHTVATLFATQAGRDVALSVVGGGPVREPGPVVMTVDGVPAHVATITARTVLSWRRGGETTVMSAAAVPTLWLLNLARAVIASRPVPVATGAR